MLKQVAFGVGLALLLSMDVQAGIFGTRGGCPNGQCGRAAYEQPAKVAVQANAPAQAVAQASATEASPRAVAAVTTQQDQQVASQTGRSRLFRRWSR